MNERRIESQMDFYRAIDIQIKQIDICVNICGVIFDEIFTQGKRIYTYIHF